MKILRVSLSNLASIAGEQEILFEQAPLAHAGLIAITGKTGAGKSTLLDAMCLALYDRVPRLNGAVGSIKDVGGADLSLKDPKHILRRGATSGFAELEFIAIDGKRYQARWEVWRAHKKPDGNLKYNRAITCLDEQRVLNHKVSEATPLIEQLIGLSFEQFTRAVLLPQSEVGAFLKAKDHERADLLEYLTNSQIFSEVSKKAADKYSEIKQQRANLEKQLGNIEVLSQQELQQLEQQHQGLKYQIEHLSQTEKLLENDLKWHKDHHELYASTQAKKEVYEVQLDADVKLHTQKKLLAQLDAFQEIRAQYQTQKYAQLRLSQLTQDLKNFEPQLQQAHIQYEQAAQQLHQAEQNLNLWHSQREQLKPQLEKATQLDHEIHSKLQQHQTLKQEQQLFFTRQVQPLELQWQQLQTNFNQALKHKQQLELQLQQQQEWAIFDTSCATTTQRLNDYVQQYQLLQTTQPELLQHPLQALQQQHSELQQRIFVWKNQYQQLGLLEQQLQQKQHLLQQQDQSSRGLERLEQHATQIIQNEQQHQRLIEQHASKQKIADDFKLSISTHQQKVQHSQITLQQLEQVFEQQRLLQHQSVQELRAQLKPNEACMVCGSHTHPFVEHADLLTNALGQLQDQQLQQAKQEYEQLHQQLKELEIEASKADATLQQQQHQIDALAQSIGLQRQKLHTELQIQAFNFDAQQPTTEILQAICLNLVQVSKNIQQLQLELQHDQQIVDTWRLVQRQAEQLQFGLQQRQQLEQLIEAIVLQFNDVQQQHWQANSVHYAAQILQQLQQRQQLLKALAEQQQHCEQVQAELNQQQLKLEILQKQSQEKLDQLAQIANAGKSLRDQLNTLTKAYAGRPYQKVSEWQATLDQEHQALQQAIAIQRLALKNSEQQRQQLQLQQQHLDSQITLNTQQLQQAVEHIALWINTHPEMQPSVIEQCLAIEHDQHQTIRQDLLNHQQALDRAKSAWQTLDEHYAKHLKQQPDLGFEQVQEQLKVLTSQQQNQQDAFNTLDAKLRMNASNQANYAKYQSQIEHIKAQEYRWGRIYDLIGHKEGTKFKKIAQEHHLDILVEYANQQLQPLAPRYQLHRIADSLSLAVIDLDMNSEIRPVLSLSGGETFLVSLALALAIANMAAGSMKLESLFIDEGFGTLDPASLHMVMNALDHLQSQGRKVVLISHIQEMHERIPVQIQVKPLGSGASTIKIVG